MNSLSFSLNSSISGGNITSFRYSHSLNELVGSWSAEVANGSFIAGQSFSVHNVMEGAIISNAYKDADGLWHLEGKDAGYKLMKSLPDIADLPTTDNVRSLILHIVSSCGLPLDMSEAANLSGLTSDEVFEARCLLSASTCAEAILELAMFCGCIAYINQNGHIVVAKPKLMANSHSFDDKIINDSGSSFDLDGYATHVVVQLSCLHMTDDEEDDETDVLSDDNLPRMPYEESFSGSFPNGNYSMTLLMPHGVIKSLRTSISEGNVTVETKENHEYHYKAKNLWRDHQEFGLYAIIEKSYSLERITQKTPESPLL